MSAGETIAVIGGSGALGRGIARRLLKAGRPIVIGSRDAQKAEAAAQALVAEVGGTACGGDNLTAAKAAAIVFVAVPFASQRETLAAIAPACAGKIVIDCTVPLVPPKIVTVQLPKEGSAAAIAAAALGPQARLVTGFHSVAAAKLAADGDVGCDILLFSDDLAAREAVAGLCTAMGLTGVEAGPLANSVAGEAMTSVLIGVNRRYRTTAGVRITGLAG